MALPEFMQVRQAARVLGVHENTLRRWEESGVIDAARLPSGVRRFRADDVERLRAEIYGPDRGQAHEAAVAAAEQAMGESRIAVPAR